MKRPLPESGVDAFLTWEPARWRQGGGKEPARSRQGGGEGAKRFWLASLRSNVVTTHEERSSEDLTRRWARGPANFLYFRTASVLVYRGQGLPTVN